MRTALRLLLASLLFATTAHAQQHTKRLILKDGGYQSITSYEIQGDNVHYYSAERYMWEDIPKSFVDWDATNKYNANPVKNDRSREDREFAEEEAADLAKDEAEAPTVAPRLHLPDADIGGVYLLDEWQKQPELAEIVQNGADVASPSKKSILRVTVNPLGKLHEAFTLQGAHARVQSHLPSPTIFLCIEAGENAVNVSDHYRIVRVDSDENKKTRSVGTLNTKISGKTSQTQNFIPSTASKVNTGPWVKITPTAPLAPGEYAVVEMLGENEMNLYVWDFGINPSAPENINVTKPLPTRPTTPPHN
jgi:hypothetical protein